jgi:hypothetical protein
VIVSDCEFDYLHLGRHGRRASWLVWTSNIPTVSNQLVRLGLQRGMGRSARYALGDGALASGVE